MFIIDGPYVSNYLKESIYNHKIKVVKTPFAVNALDKAQTNFIDEQDAIAKLLNQPREQIYTNSENALEWIYKSISTSERVETLQKVKDKVKFRDALRTRHPDFYFRSVDVNGLQDVIPASIPFPVILKPSVGFFSLGVHRIADADEWHQAIKRIEQERAGIEGLYPAEVLDSETFIIEEVIPGTEYAVDCYYNDKGDVVILNIMKHLFASEKEVNDRVYITSVEIMEASLEPIKDYLQTLGDLLQLQNFPSHIEVRVDAGGQMNAIEINPLRFGGWCSTPDVAHYAWGINVYQYVEEKLQPRWDELLSKPQENVYALVVLDNTSGVAGRQIKSFNYDALLELVSEPLDLRRTDYRRFPVFGFLICKVPRVESSELELLLQSSLREFIECQE